MEHDSYADKLTNLEWRRYCWDDAFYGPCEECGSKRTYRTKGYVLICKDCNHKEYIG